MPIIADLHIHSRYSRATSSRLTPPYLDRWARIKGIGLVGSGDCTHPRWLSELRENFVDAEPGLFVLKNDVRSAFDAGTARAEELPVPGGEVPGAVPRFVLSGEISTIYKREGKTRKVHHLVLLPDFRAAAAFQTKLERIGNIGSDGRPILGLDSRDLLALLLEADERSLLVPAHIWTPWFSALGAKSGFDSIEECYGDLVSFIPAIETGLSSDPPMNWALSSLDRYAIISNSDAHSPVNLEFFPEEGKYHYDGHRKCGICIGPNGLTLDGGNPALAGEGGEKLCPVCGRELTRGVMGRVLELADRPVGGVSADSGGNRRPYHSLIPLREILGELLGTGPGSKKVDAAYSALIEKTGSEFSLLMDMGIGEVEKLNVRFLSGELLALALDRMRRGEVSISPGYDGEYGVVRVFPSGVSGGQGSGCGTLFDEGDSAGKKTGSRRGGVNAANAKNKAIPASADTAQKPVRSAATLASGPGSAAVQLNFDPVQREIINHEGNRVIIIAGPGTGKTAVLAARIAKIIDNGAEPDSILALSFTIKAAAELRERIERLLGGERRAGTVNAATFHSFCCALLREQAPQAGIAPDFGITGEERREELLRELCNAAAGKGKKGKPKAGKLGNYIEGRKRFLLLPGEQGPGIGAAVFESLGITPPEPLAEMEDLYHQYRNRLRDALLLDYEDLIAGTVRLFSVKKPVLAEYCRRFRYIFVDEYQDINLSQYALLRLLAEGGNPAPSLWVIGDPNQAIYGFRGSDKRFIDRFTIDYPEARKFELAKSFRCAEPLISAAGKLAGAKLRGTEKPVELFRAEYATDKAEAEGIARIISRLIGGATFFAKDSDDADQGCGGTEPGTAAPGDCAVLIRAAPLAGPVVKALTDHGIPFALSGEQCWWEEEPFHSFLDRVRQSAGPEIALQKEKDNPALRRLFDLAALFGNVPSLLDALAISGPGALPEFNREGVRIMTIHSSKGLEFDHVFVAGLEEGLMPFTLYDENAAGDTARIEEERRLLYVAMTRARLGLYLSCASSRNFKGRKLDGKPSRFLGELEKIIPLAENKRPLRKDDQLRLF